MTYSDIKKEIRADGLGDPYGTCMHWWFSAAEVLHFERSEGVPEAWGFRPSPIATAPEADTFAVEVLREASTDDIYRIGNLLARWREIISARGDDY